MPSQKRHIAADLTELLREEARKRMLAGNTKGNPLEKPPEGVKGDVREIAGSMMGVNEGKYKNPRDARAGNRPYGIVRVRKPWYFMAASRKRSNAAAVFWLACWRDTPSEPLPMGVSATRASNSF